MSTEGSGEGGAVRRGDGVRLVPPTAEHVPMLIELGQDPQYRRWGEGTVTDTDAAARAWAVVARRRWEAPSAHTPRPWVVEVVDDGGWVPAGIAEYRRDGHGGGEVGYAVHPARRGHGVATAALRLAVQHAFEVDGLQLLTWRSEAGHWASRRVAWRVGFATPQLVRGLLPGRGGADRPRDGWISTLAPGEEGAPAHPWLEATPLAAAGIRLRPWQDDEVDRLALMSTDELSRTYVGPVLPPPDAEGVARWLLTQRDRMASGAAVTWCIADAEDDLPLGYISVFDLQHPFARGCGEVGYWLLPRGRGRGVMTAALRAVSVHAFGDLGLHRIAALTDERNVASQRALLRAGFRQIATESQSCVYAQGGERHDTCSFELLADAAGASMPGPRRSPGEPGES